MVFSNIYANILPILVLSLFVLIGNPKFQELGSGAARQLLHDLCPLHVAVLAERMGLVVEGVGDKGRLRAGGADGQGRQGGTGGKGAGPGRNGHAEAS